MHQRRATWTTVVELAKKLPAVAEGISYGTPSLTVAGKFLARLKEDGDTMAIRIDFADREVLLEMYPKAFYLTDHYRDYPAVLVRLKKVHLDVLERLVAESWRQRAPKKLLEVQRPSTVIGASPRRRRTRSG